VRARPRATPATASVPQMTHAVVLVKGEREALADLGSRLFVAILRLRKHDQLAEVVTGRLAQIPGIADTYTMVAFEVFSKHDLEAMFSIGA
jgi:DNA-binding Lrp family transcriptional regulator